MSAIFDFKTFPILETERLVLREIRLADTAALMQIFGDPEVVRYMDQDGPYTTVEEIHALIAFIDRNYKAQNAIRWAITLKESADLIGTCGFHLWDRQARHIEMGYDLARRCWGQGIIPEALRAIIQFGFERLGVNRIEANVTVGNRQSARVLQKLGFTEEGILRERGYWGNRHHDLRWFSLLKREFDSSL